MSYDTYIRDLQSKTQNQTAYNLHTILTGDLNVSNSVYTPSISGTTCSFQNVAAGAVVSGPTGIFTGLQSTNLTTTNASITSLTGTNIYGSVFGPTGSFNNFQAGSLQATNVSAANVSFTSATGTNIYGSVFGPTGYFANVQSTNLQTTNLTTSTLTTSSLTTTTASTTSLSVGGQPLAAINGASVSLNGSNTSLTISVPSTTRRMRVLLQDFKTNGVSNPGIYLAANTGTPLCSGLTIGTLSNGKATFGPSVPARLWNTTWAATNLLNMSLEISLADLGGVNKTYILSGHGFLNNTTISYCGVYGYLTIPSGSDITGVVINTSGSANTLQSGTIFLSYQ